MTRDDDFIGQLESYLDEFEGATPLPAAVRGVVRAQLLTTTQLSGFPKPMRFLTMNRQLQIALAAVAALAVGLAALSALSPRIGSEPTPTENPTVDLGIFEPVAGWVVYGDESGIWGDNPDGDDVKLAIGAGSPLGWSRDGTRLLVDGEHLFILHTDGSETQLTADSRRTGGATISPDGSRVVFEDHGDGQQGLYAVDAGGGPAELLIELENPEGVSFSPDGTHIAYVTGSGDNSHRVWVMDADGSNSRLVVANDTTLGGGHVHGLAWSPAGDRIAFGLSESIWTFAPDGSGFSVAVPNTGRLEPFWSPDGVQLETKGPWHPGRSVGPLSSPSPTPTPTVAPPLDAGVAELLNDFLAARVAGTGAEQYLSTPDDVVFGDLPLPYATTSNSDYDRAGFKQVLGVEWPYGLTAFTFRLLAGRDVVEQLIFVAHEDGRLVVEYVPDSFGTDIAPTTENGLPVARPYVAFGGEVTLDVAHPWAFHFDGGPIKLVPQAAQPTTDGGERNDWDRLVLIADPVRSGLRCPTGAGPADAEALAESIRSDPNIEATASVAVSAGGAKGLMLDVAVAAGATGVCGGLDGLTDQVSLAMGERMRLYLFDAPAASSMQMLAVAIVVPESQFERASAAAASLSVEFHVP